MKPSDFRKLALSIEGAVESSHMGHPDFRVGGKIFATIGVPDAGCAMVKLTPEQQRDFVAFEPAIFSVLDNGWGKRGATLVLLGKATAKAVRPALELARANCAGSGKRRDA